MPRIRAKQIVPGTEGQVLRTTGGLAAWASASALSGVAHVAYGTYVGDGNADRAISTGLGTPIRLLYLQDDAGGMRPWFKASTMSGKVAVSGGGDTTSSGGPGIAFSSNDFTVDLVAGTLINATSAAYHWVAIG